MAAIDVGAAATDRATKSAGGITWIEGSNPADGIGTITSVEVFLESGSGDTDATLATFYVESGDNLTARDSENIGAITAGSKQTFSGLTLSVETGDYLGIFVTDNSPSYDSSGGTHVWWKVGDHTAASNQAYANADTFIMSLYGTGTTGGVTTNTKINIGDVWKDVADIKINIGDVWKDVADVQQNIGDSWKSVYT